MISKNFFIHDQQQFSEPDGWCTKTANDSPLFKDFSGIWLKLSPNYRKELTPLAFFRNSQRNVNCRKVYGDFKGIINLMMRIDKILCDIVAIEHGFQHILDGADKILSAYSKEQLF